MRGEVLLMILDCSLFSALPVMERMKDRSVYEYEIHTTLSLLVCLAFSYWPAFV
jgi:hypothetical protein